MFPDASFRSYTTAQVLCDIYYNYEMNYSIIVWTTLTYSLQKDMQSVYPEPDCTHDTIDIDCRILLNIWGPYWIRSKIIRVNQSSSLVSIGIASLFTYPQRKKSMSGRIKSGNRASYDVLQTGVHHFWTTCRNIRVAWQKMVLSARPLVPQSLSQRSWITIYIYI